MSAGSTGWGQGLRGGEDPAVTRVMTNMVSRMRYRFGIVYAVDSGNLRWYRDWNQNGTGDIGTGSTIGTGGSVLRYFVWVTPLVGRVAFARRITLRAQSLVRTDAADMLKRRLKQIAGHADSRTTKLYDRRGQKVLLEDMERIRY
jgi:hypothetical protein